MSLKTSQEKFLSNSKNKSQFIKILSSKLIESSIACVQADSDADYLIVKTAINLEHPHTAIVAEDVDILVILNALTPENKKVYLIKPAKGKVSKKVYSSSCFTDRYKDLKKSHLLFIHAFTGCDTTSAFYGKGKNKFLKIFEKRQDLQNSANIFLQHGAKENDLLKAGTSCILAYYGAPINCDDLNYFRYKCFNKGTAKNTSVHLQSLPPTVDAAMMHFKRVYLQIQAWQGNFLPPENWGWQINENLSPTYMLQPPAPENILKIIFCSCKSGCGPACGCRKSGLYCTTACVTCNGEGALIKLLLKMNMIMKKSFVMYKKICNVKTYFLCKQFIFDFSN